jgi:hypothetical protein
MAVFESFAALTPVLLCACLGLFVPTSTYLAFRLADSGLQHGDRSGAIDGIAADAPTSPPHDPEQCVHLNLEAQSPKPAASRPQAGPSVPTKSVDIPLPQEPMPR